MNNYHPFHEMHKGYTYNYFKKAIAIRGKNAPHSTGTCKSVITGGGNKKMPGGSARHNLNTDI